MSSHTQWAGEGLVDAVTFRGLLHDLGHGLATLSYLVEAIRGDSTLRVDTRRFVELLERQLALLARLVCEGPWNEHESEPVAVRVLAEHVVSIAELSSPTSVKLVPGTEINLNAGTTRLWRVLFNLIDNAVRAAGPGGRVDVVVAQEQDAVIEVIDDGPGMGGGPPDLASLGLAIVSGLLANCGGRLGMQPVEPHGTRVRLAFSQPGADTGRPTDRQLGRGTDG